MAALPMARGFAVQVDEFPAGNWDATSITAKYDGLLVDSKYRMIYYFVLQNNTGHDFELAGQNGVQVYAAVAGQAGAAQLLPRSEMLIRYPVLVRAHQTQVIYLLDMKHDYGTREQLKEHYTERDMLQYQTTAKAAVRKTWPELNGFRIYNPATLRMIALPRGW